MLCSPGASRCSLAWPRQVPLTHHLLTQHLPIQSPSLLWQPWLPQFLQIKWICPACPSPLLLTMQRLVPTLKVFPCCFLRERMAKLLRWTVHACCYLSTACKLCAVLMSLPSAVPRFAALLSLIVHYNAHTDVRVLAHDCRGPDAVISVQALMLKMLARSLSMGRLMSKRWVICRRASPSWPLVVFLIGAIAGTGARQCTASLA